MKLFYVEQPRAIYRVLVSREVNQQYCYWFRCYILGLKVMAPVVTSQLMTRNNDASKYTDLRPQAYSDTHSYLGSK
jgi:hypothetical protein